MTISLVTGTPGSGKTLYAVWHLQKEIKAGRRIVVNGIRDLAIEHEMVDDAWVRDWHNRAQQNDLIVVDEVQRIWPPVAMGSKPSEDIEKLHVHRHMGIDFVVITQHPQRLNKTIRDLVGRHVHVRRLFGMRRAMLYEWDHCHNPNAGFRDAVKTVWNYPRKVFDLYTSAEVHTKQKAVIPKALFILPVAVLVAVALGWLGYKGVRGGFGARTGSHAEGVSGGSASSGGSGDASGALGVGSMTWRVVGEYSIGTTGYVLLASSDGRARSVVNESFRGESLRVEGVVDGQRVATWTGGHGQVPVAAMGARQ